MATVQPNGAAKAPISSHKAFPAIVALWFAALFGIGSFILPSQLLESIASGTGLASVLPAAQAPLGVTAKILIALLASGIGIALGLWVARKIAASQAPVPQRKRAPNIKAADAHPDAPARRPISAMEELGEEKLAESVPEEDGVQDEEPAPRRRRALSVTEESGRSEYLDMVPLPGEAENSDDVLDFSDHPDMQSAEDPAQEVAFKDSPELVLEPEVEPEPLPFAAPAPAFAVEEEEEPLELVSEEIAEETFAEDFEPAEELIVDPVDEAEDVAELEEPILQTDSNVPVADRPLDGLGMVELVERLGISMKKRKETPVPLRAAISDSFFAATAIPEKYAPTDAPAADLTEEIEEAAQALPSNFGALPAGLQSLMINDLDDDEDEEDEDDAFPALDLTKSLRPFAAEAAEVAESAPEDEPETFSEEIAAFSESEQGDEDDAETDDESYTSLLAMKSPFLPGQEPVRIEEDDSEDGDIQPMVVFPGQAANAFTAPANEPAASTVAPIKSGDARPFDAPSIPGTTAAPAPLPVKSDPAETEKALRDALSTLRRMSGAA